MKVNIVSNRNNLDEYHEKKQLRKNFYFLILVTLMRMPCALVFETSGGARTSHQNVCLFAKRKLIINTCVVVFHSGALLFFSMYLYGVAVI